MRLRRPIRNDLKEWRADTSVWLKNTRDESQYMKGRPKRTGLSKAVVESKQTPTAMHFLTMRGIMQLSSWRATAAEAIDGAGPRPLRPRSRFYGLQDRPDP